MCIGFPESSLRGFCIGCAGRAADGSEVVARVRRELHCVRDGVLLFKVRERGLVCFTADGARKSRYNGREVAAMEALLKALVDWVWADLRAGLVAALLIACKHNAHMFVVVAIVDGW